MESKKEIRQKFGISPVTLWRIMQNLKSEMDVSKRLFCGKELERIYKEIETRKL